MINKERIDKIKAEFFSKGLEVSTTDVGFAVLSNVMGDDLAYEAIFGGAVMGDYARSERITKLKEKVADYIGGDSIAVGVDVSVLHSLFRAPFKLNHISLVFLKGYVRFRTATDNNAVTAYVVRHFLL